MTRNFKTCIGYFNHLEDKNETFWLEDVGYEIGDVLRVSEYDFDERGYTGRHIDLNVTSISRPDQNNPVNKGYVRLGFSTTGKPGNI